MPHGRGRKHWLFASAKPFGVYHSWIHFPLWHTWGERCLPSSPARSTVPPGTTAQCFFLSLGSVLAVGHKGPSHANFRIQPS